MLSREDGGGEPSEDGYAYDCILSVPPFLKYAGGPLLGPALLEGAAESSGLRVKTIDANIQFMHASGILKTKNESSDFYGDHSKPTGELRVAADKFWAALEEGFSFHRPINRNQIRNGWLSHQQIYSAVEKLSYSGIGRFLRNQLTYLPRPRLFGVSVLWAGQVIPGLLLSRISKEIWPETMVVWGGAHITAIKQNVSTDPSFYRWIDGFLPGHCEQSFVDLVISVKSGRFDCAGLIKKGEVSAELPRLLLPPPFPKFPDLVKYGYPVLALPIELSTGCAYAQCSFCTYPATEGRYERLPLDNLARMVELAVSMHATISIKDSLVTVDRLRAIGQIIAGRVEWSACTKLTKNLDPSLLSELSKSGCRTLEVGLESLDPETQQRIHKIQPFSLLEEFLKGAERAGISIVINYMTGFPWEKPNEAEAILENFRRYVGSRKGLKARIEHNYLNLERLSPMAQFPAEYGIEVTREWPWASILEWRPAKRVLTSTASSPQTTISTSVAFLRQGGREFGSG